MSESISEKEWWLNMGNVSNKVSEVTAEDLWNVANNLAKWQAIWWQIRDDQRKNTNTGKFLTYLLLNVQNESIRSCINMFVRYVAIPDSDKQHMTIMTDEIVWLFLPLYSDVADQFDLAKQYPIDYHQKNTDVVAYTDYISQVIVHYPDILTLNPDTFTTLVLEIIKTYNIVDTTQTQQDKTLQLKHHLIQKFFGTPSTDK